MEKVSSGDGDGDGNGEHIASVRGLSQSKSFYKRSRNSDAGIRKRVKFSEPEAIRNGALPRNEGAHFSCYDGAKTTEFKSFKRLLEKTAHKHCFDKVAKSDIKLKKGKATGCMEASRRASLAVQNVSSSVHGFLSSPTLVLQKQAIENKAKENNGAGRSVPLSKITSVDGLFHPSPLIAGKNCGGGHSGTMQEHQGTFSQKRACLLQLAAGTCSQNIDDFLSNRSDFILEILQRLGIRKDANKHEKLQNSEQKMNSPRFPPSSKGSNQIVQFCGNPEDDLCAYKTEQYDKLLALKWDKTEIQALSWNPYNHSPKTNIKSKHWKSDLFTEKALTLLPDLDNPASTIELIKEFDFSEYRYNDKAQGLLNSPCNTSEVDAFLTNMATYMGQSCKKLCCNSVLDHKELVDLCLSEDSDTSLNSKLELNSSSRGFRRRTHDSFQADCILPNSYNSESFFQEEALSKEQFTFPLLEWDAAAEQELPTPKCLVSKELDQFTESPLYDTYDFDDEIGSSSFFDVDGRKSFSFFTELRF